MVSSEAVASPGLSEAEAQDPLLPLLRAQRHADTQQPLTLVGRLVALADGGARPLVAWPGQAGAAALSARSTVDLLPHQIGLDVLLTFDDGDRAKPIVIGVLRGQQAELPAQLPSTVLVESDGQRVMVTARDELVLRCGRSSITMGADGRMTLKADVIVSEAAELNRVRGGSVQLN